MDAGGGTAVGAGASTTSAGVGGASTSFTPTPEECALCGAVSASRFGGMLVEGGFSGAAGGVGWTRSVALTPLSPASFTPTSAVAPVSGWVLHCVASAWTCGLEPAVSGVGADRFAAGGCLAGAAPSRGSAAPHDGLLLFPPMAPGYENVHNVRGNVVDIVEDVDARRYQQCARSCPNSGMCGSAAPLATMPGVGCHLVSWVHPCLDRDEGPFVVQSSQEKSSPPTPQTSCGARLLISRCTSPSLWLRAPAFGDA